MGRQRSYSDEDLTRAVHDASSWRGVLRNLGLSATSAAAVRSVRKHADRLALDYGHFTGQRRWRDAQLAEAVASSRSWSEVAERLGLAGGSSLTSLKGHAARLDLPTDHLRPRRSHLATPPVPLQPQIRFLPRSGSLLAAAWFSLCGHEVSWPLEPTVYDLVVWIDQRFRRVQVKTTTMRAGGSWVARLHRSGSSDRTYDPDDVDYFFVIDGDLDYYLIPVAAVGGLQSIHLAAYQAFRLTREVAAS